MKLLLSPLRLAVGWGAFPSLLGWPGLLMLVLLRVTIGWHFYTEGMDKYSAGDWDAKPFFANAKGPFASHYHQLVWDWNGEIRLNAKLADNVFRSYRNRAITHYGFNDAQKRQADANYQKALAQLDWILQSNAEDIAEYKLGRERIEKLEQDPMRDQVSSMRGQRETIKSEWMKKLAPTLTQIDAVWETYENAQNQVATLKQSSARPLLKLDRPRTERIDTSLLNQVVPYFDMAIGVCLMLGLFTPVAALAAAGFLGSVFLSQYPPATGPSSTMYQLIEGCACLVLAGTGAGRFAGIDHLLHTLVRKFWPHQEA